MALTLFSDTGKQIETQIGDFSSLLSSALISNLMPVITTCVILYFTLKGWMFLTGRAQGAISDTVISAFKITLIAFIGLNTGNFINLGIGTINSLESFLISSLPRGVGTSWSMIDKLWESVGDSFFSMFDVFKVFGVTDIGYALLWAFIFIIFALVGAGLTTAALGVLVMAKISLVIVVGFGPLFICTLMFPLTRSWFDGWLKACLTYIFTLVIMAALVSLVIIIFQGQLEIIYNKAKMVTTNGSVTALPALVAQVLSFLIIIVALASMIKMIPSMAAGVVGGVAMQAVGLGAMLTGTSAGALNMGMATALAAGHVSGSKKLTGAASNYFSGQSALGKAVSSEGGLGAYALGATITSPLGSLRAKRAIQSAITSIKR